MWKLSAMEFAESLFFYAPAGPESGNAEKRFVYNCLYVFAIYTKTHVLCMLKKEEVDRNRSLRPFCTY